MSADAAVAGARARRRNLLLLLAVRRAERRPAGPAVQGHPDRSATPGQDSPRVSGGSTARG